ncbi:MAG TPA: double-strand break repair helicase AddA [Geminicoccaceae bacterium]|nr:double-strand break repair helicase AddA [Geminicoccaceae bacterium]
MRPEAPTPEQRRAADPAVSVWVTANAGTGKTRVLADRVLRLLLAGAYPESILGITFTKAAAAEMTQRVERRLAGWAVAKDDGLLAEELEALTGQPGQLLVATARRLFARVLDLPRGLAVMTIHGLCSQLLRRFPIEAGIAPHFEVIDDRTARELLIEARGRVLGEARRADQTLDKAIEALALTLAETTLTEVLDEAIAARGRLEAAKAAAGGLAGLLAVIARELDVEGDAEPHDLVAAACVETRFDGTALRACIGNPALGPALAASLPAWLGTDDEGRARLFENYCAAFLTSSGEARKRLVSKALGKASPAAAAALLAEQERLVRLQGRLRAAMVFRRTRALLIVADAVIRAYETLKDQAGQLDYDDLIERAGRLLETPESAQWVLFKLDQCLDHVLVDEAQDTSPAQWRIVLKLTEEFFAGQGAHDRPRTLFVVGDEKQSIYSFQGADLSTFRSVRQRLEVLAQGSSHPLHRERLSQSFRSTAAVLELVDSLLAVPELAEGVVEPGDAVVHTSVRADVPGRVELWPLAAPRERRAEQEPWPLPDRPRAEDDPSRRVAEAVAQHIRHWIDSREILESVGRPIAAGDVLVLLRRRGQVQEQLVRALKRRGVPVAGADRLALTEHIAVRDLMALGRVALLPEDDLNLACLLKSPLLGLDEEDLFGLARDRGQSGLMERFRAAAAEGRHAEAHERLAGWLRQADFMPPFELYADVLGRGGGRRRLLARLGPDAAEPIEGFLAQALAYERGHPASLEGFLHWLEMDRQELKRDPETGRDAVRVVTVHGAKGLEAPIVILADSGPHQQPSRSRILWRPDDGLPFWRAPKAERDPVTQAVEDLRQRAEAEERRRLLYVALTRARDRLYVTGWRLNREAGEGEPCWHETVGRGLAACAGLAEVEHGLGAGFDGKALRLSRGHRPRAEPPVEAESTGELPLPAWATSPAAAEPAPPRPLAPSRLDATEPPAASPVGEDATRRFRFGLCVHKLLQLLPDLPAGQRPAAMARYLAGVDLDPADAERLERQVTGILGHPGLAEVFGPGSRAEQAICGVVGGVAIAGQIDRLAVTPERVILVDYKTNRRPPRTAAETPLAYLRQMAAYRRLLGEIYLGWPVEAALVWTETGEVARLESGLLDAHIPQAPVLAQGPA